MFVNTFAEELDVTRNSLEQVFKSDFWRALVNKWSGPGKIMECAMTCGEKFTKVWDQGGSVR
jgi:hypothetical protein